MLNRKHIECDLCVIGAGLSGMCAAISAAREGVKVVLMHERPVLGGNASSEIRMWICGAQGKDNRETGILEEIALENLYRNPTKSYAVWDTVLYDFILKEENITLLLNCTCMDASTEEGQFKYGREKRIKSVTGYQMTTQTFFDVDAKYFCDSSGDSILAPLTGANFRVGRESKYEFGENTDREIHDSMTMGMSCLIQGRETAEPIKYIPPQWSQSLNKSDFENRNPNLYNDNENFWYLELGGNKNTIDDTENVRHELIALATGTWDYIKNSGEFNAENWDLNFLGFLPGKRESRRMCGEYVIKEQDITEKKVFEDEIAFGGWPLDDHFPGGFYHKGVPNTYYDTPAPYSIPYRALYSENVENLFFAGRNISMTHTAMSSIRVMATCGLLGEAVGKAVAIANNNGICPHEVYVRYLEKLQGMLMDEDVFLPSKVRKISDECKEATLSIKTDVIRNGEDRAHVIYNTDDISSSYHAKCGEEIRYSNIKKRISHVHIVFSSDLNRETLPGSLSERVHSTRCNTRLDSPQMHMPKTLCREFVVYAEYKGQREELLRVKENRKRCYHINVDKEFDSLILVPLDSWGDKNDVPIISFDF